MTYLPKIVLISWLEERQVPANKAYEYQPVVQVQEVCQDHLCTV